MEFSTRSAASDGENIATSLPHDLDAERAVLAAAILSADSRRIVLDLPPSAFHLDGHRVLRDVLSQAEVVTAAVTITSISQMVAAHRNAAAVAALGRSYVAGLLAAECAPVNVPRHCAALRRLAHRRAQIEAGLAAQRDDADPVLIDERFRAVANSGGDRAPVIIRSMAEMEAMPVEWLWRQWIPLGMLAVLDGDPKTGKSTALLDIAARLSRGDRMPDGSQGPEASGIIFLTAEDDLARVIRPRLEAAGADLSRVFNLRLRDGDGEREIALAPADVAEVERAVIEHRVRLVVIDPLMAYLPQDVNAHRDQDVRRALALLRDLAEGTGAAVVVIRHLNKSPGGPALYRGGGSIGIVAAARAGLLLAKDPDDDEVRVLAVNGANLAPEPQAMRMRLVVEPGSVWPRVVWEGTSTHTVASLLAVPDPEERSKVDEAADFLRAELEAGPRNAAVAIRAARAQGISERTLRRARKTLGVVANKVGQPGSDDQKWFWSLPVGDDGHDSAPEASNTPDVGRLRDSRDSDNCNSLPDQVDQAAPETAKVPDDVGRLQADIEALARRIVDDVAGGVA